jgi:hypothetical protein
MGKGKNMNCPIVLKPAYGRKYDTPEELIAAYESGLDFKIICGPYCSCRDFIGQTVYLQLFPGCYVEKSW